MSRGGKESSRGKDKKYNHAGRLRINKINVEVTRLQQQAMYIRRVCERYECDALVMNPDLPVVWRDLLGKTPLNIKRLKYSPSCVTLLVGSSKKYEHTGDQADAGFNRKITVNAFRKRL